jgi:hypothetical protein
MSHQTHFLLATYTKTSADALDVLKSFGSNAWEGATSFGENTPPPLFVESSARCRACLHPLNVPTAHSLLAT